MPEPSDKSSLFLFFEGLDAESRSLAKKLDQLKYFYYLYGIWDGLSVSAGTLTYFFNVFYADGPSSSNDVMHDWMDSPAGAAVAATEAITMVTFSLLANIFDDDDKNAFKRYIAIAWPYCRDSMKGLKNGYKGIRSTLQAVGMLSGYNLQYMIVPMGVVLGALSVVNRVWTRKYVKEPRVAMMKANGQLLLEIQGTAFYFFSELPQAAAILNYKNSYILVGEQLHYVNQDGSIQLVPISDRTLFNQNVEALNPDKATTLKLFLSHSEIQTLITKNGGHTPPINGYDKQYCDEIRKNRIGRQTEFIKTTALISAAYGGIVDGLYLYMGALGLTILSPPVFMVMAVCSTIFALMCVTTRVYEEFDFQRKLESTEAKVEVALCCKEIEFLLGTMRRVSSPLPRLDDTELETFYNQLQQSDNPNISSQVTELGTLLHTVQDLLAQGDTGRNYDTARQTYLTKLMEIYHEENKFKMQELKAKRNKLRSLVTSSGVLGVFSGLRSGLAAYGAITSLMFSVATINAIFLVPFSAGFLIAGVAVGMACVIAFILHGLIVHSAPPLPVELDRSNKLFLVMVSLKSTPQAPPPKKPQDLDVLEVKEAVLEGMDVVAPSRSYLTDWLETIRSLGSGLSKGPKLLELLMNMWRGLSSQEAGDDTPMWFHVAVVSAVVQAVIFAVRAFARGLGRDTPDVIKLPTRTIKSPETPISRMSSSSSPSSELGDNTSTIGLDGLESENEEISSPRATPVFSEEKSQRSSRSLQRSIFAPIPPDNTASDVTSSSYHPSSP